MQADLNAPHIHKAHKQLSTSICWPLLAKHMPTQPPTRLVLNCDNNNSGSLMLGGQAPLASELSGDLASEPCPGWQHQIWGA